MEVFSPTPCSEQGWLQNQSILDMTQHTPELHLKGVHGCMTQKCLFLSTVYQESLTGQLGVVK